jgi:hypothetical protein
MMLKSVHAVVVVRKGDGEYKITIFASHNRHVHQYVTKLKALKFMSSMTVLRLAIGVQNESTHPCEELRIL